MKCKSVSTMNADGYRAGCEIGDALCEIRPEVVLLFASITYSDQFEDLFEGLYDALGNRDVILFGGTSDGVYETEQILDNGISALALNSEGQVDWITAIECGVQADTYGAAKKCAERIHSDLEGQVDFAFTFADGLKADGSKVVSGVSSVLKVPFIGALTGDDRKFARSFILINGEAREDAVAILAARGPVQIVMNAASGWCPTGNAGTIESCDGPRVDRISGMSPQQFFRTELGKLPGETDLGMVALASYQANGDGHYALLTPSNIDQVSGAATMFGSVEQDTEVRVCSASLEDVLNGVDEAMLPLQTLSFEPVAALVISCAGRRWLLEERSREEVERVFNVIGHRIPLAGFPSFGEIGPFIRKEGGYSPTFFHNVTFVVCLFGAT